VFLVNSRVGRFAAAPSRSPSQGRFTLLGRPLSRSYGANLPSSLTRDHPSTLVLSHPATGVGLRYGRPRLPPRAFSRRLGSTESPKAGAFESLTPRQNTPEEVPPAGFDAPCPMGALGLPNPATRGDFDVRGRGRNIDRLSIAYAFRPRLRPA
jgi:hypothetical protein